jgi:hypothetical protein
MNKKSREDDKFVEYVVTYKQQAVVSAKNPRDAARTINDKGMGLPFLRWFSSDGHSVETKEKIKILSITRLRKG